MSTNHRQVIYDVYIFLQYVDRKIATIYLKMSTRIVDNYIKSVDIYYKKCRQELSTILNKLSSDMSTIMSLCVYVAMPCAFFCLQTCEVWLLARGEKRTLVKTMQDDHTFFRMVNVTIYLAWSVFYIVWSVFYIVWSVFYIVWSVFYNVWSVFYNVWSVFLNCMANIIKLQEQTYFLCMHYP